MIQRTSILVALITIFSSGLLNLSINNLAYALQDNIKAAPQSVSGSISGKVTDAVDVSGYTYAQIDTGKEKVWAAGPITALTKGDMIEFSTQMPMKDFHSKSMQRDFSIIYFVNRFITNKDASSTKDTVTALPHDQLKEQKNSQPVKEISKVEGGHTIAEIYAQKNNLSGKIIRVRGQVVKFSANIMGKNWLHVRDSSTLEDLTVTTNSIATINDIIIIEGKLELDKDFGYGYVYPVILENAKISKELTLTRN